MGDSLVVNLFGGPGTGKSTNAALLFGLLKVRGHEAELAHEFAKDLVWEKREATLQFSPYVFSKQAHWIERLLGQVRVVVTDAPILLAYIYRLRGSTDPFLEHSLELHNAHNTLNIFLQRDTEHHPYVEGGRLQDQAGAMQIDQDIKTMLEDLEIGHVEVPILEGIATAEQLADLVEDELRAIDSAV